MTNEGSWQAACIVAVALLTCGCPGEHDTGGARDGPVIRYDSGGYDLGSIDSGPSTGNSCRQILQCVEVCVDASCSQQCVAAGSTEAKQRMAALDTCLQVALSGTCQSACADPKSEPCQKCAGLVCKVEMDACVRTGPGTASFGDVCDLASPDCVDGLACLDIAGGTAGKGFCTKKCPVQGQPCEGGPDGTEPGCILSTEHAADFFCGFLCAIPDETFDCPSTMSCAGTDNPPGSGQRICLP